MSAQPIDGWQRTFFTDLYTSADIEFNDPALAASMTRMVTELLVGLPGRRLLDVACGTGRHTVALGTAGFDATGVDLSPAYLETARAAALASGQDARFVQADMRDLAPIGTASFDAVVNLHTSFGFFAADDDNLDVLRAMRRTLRPGGRLVLDVINRDAFLRQTSEAYTAVAGEFVIRDFDSSSGVVYLHEERFDPLTSRIAWTITDAGRPGDAVTADYRVYSAHELITMINASGFRVTAVYGSYDLRPFHIHAPNVICLATAV